MAIIAALSVVNLNGGINVFQPFSIPAFTIASLNHEFAETPPAMAIWLIPV